MDPERLEAEEARAVAAVAPEVAIWEAAAVALGFDLEKERRGVREVDVEPGVDLVSKLRVHEKAAAVEPGVDLELRVVPEQAEAGVCEVALEEAVGSAAEPVEYPLADVRPLSLQYS